MWLDSFECHTHFQKSSKYNICPTLYKFLEWKRELNSQPITWSITFDLNLEKSNEEPLAAENKLANKLFLKSELSDVKIFCEDKIFDCHKTILCCQSEVFKGMQT